MNRLRLSLGALAAQREQLVPICAFVAATLVIAPQPFRCLRGADTAAALRVSVQPFGDLVVWALSGIALIVSLFTAASISVEEVSSSARRQPAARKWIFVVLGGFCACYSAFDLAVNPKAIYFEMVYRLLGDFEPRLASVYFSARVFGAFGVCTSVIIAIGSLAIGWQCHEVDFSELRRRWQSLERLLVLTSLGLASGAIATRARLRLQIDFKRSEPELVLSEQLVQWATIGYGGIYTLLLLAVMLPTANRLRRASLLRTAMAKAMKGDDYPDGLEAPQELGGDLWTRLAGVLAFFAPLAGSLFPFEVL